MKIEALPLATLICARFEGCILHAYDDADRHHRPIQPGDEVRGTLTIGRGRTRGVRPGDTCTQAQADVWLAEDVAEAQHRAAAFLGDAWAKLAPHQQAALVSLTYNTGAWPLVGGHDIGSAIRAGRLDDVPEALARIIHVRDRATGQTRVEPGLVKRREVETVVWDLPDFLESLRRYADRTLRQLDNVALTGVLQALLFLAGHDPGGIDGLYGPRTQAAVDALHRAAGSEPCGRMCLDAVTMLEEALERAQEGGPAHA